MRRAAWSPTAASRSSSRPRTSCSPPGRIATSSLPARIASPTGRRCRMEKLTSRSCSRKFPLDPARVHFTGLLPYSDYRKLLQATHAHVYLTRPFVLSWSVMEAMSAGALVVASRTSPVEEVIQHEHNGLLVDFFDVDSLARTIDRALTERQQLATLREKARQTIQVHYELRDCLKRRVAWMNRQMK